MLTVEIKDRMDDGKIVWQVMDVNMTLDEFTAMRKTLSEKLPTLYPTFHPLNLTATGGSMDLMAALGWIEKNDAVAMRKKAYKVIGGHMQVLAPALFQYIATYYCRVTYVDGVKLERRKCFQDQTYSKWRREQGGE
jgi:hypothetical protein